MSTPILQVVQIENKLGLHARAAAKLVRLTARFSSEIFLSREGACQQIDAKSILGILTLAATEGTQLEIEADGEDAEQAVEALAEMISHKFTEVEY